MNVFHRFLLFFKKSSIGNDFSAVTNAFDQALQNEDREEIKNCIRQNHHLLRTIGVVPDKINNFIVDVEKLGGAAKICGAGSIRGDNGGAVLVAADKPLVDLPQRYGYSLIPVQTDNQGTHVV